MSSLLPTPQDCCRPCCDEVSETSLAAAVASVVELAENAIQTIPLLRAVTTGLTNLRVRHVLGGAAIGDGGGGDYWFDATSLEADDGISVLKPDIYAVGTAGRWKKQL